LAAEGWRNVGWAAFEVFLGVFRLHVGVMPGGRGGQGRTVDGDRA
jgi:hypothetical protein